MLALWKTYEEREVEVKGHDHMTRNYWKSTHQECNLNLILSKKNLDLLRNLQIYDSHLIFQEIGKYNFKNKCDSKNNRKMYDFYYQTT